MFSRLSTTSRERVSVVAISPDSEYVAAGCYDDKGSIRVWRIADGTLCQELSSDQTRVVSWTPDGRHLVSGGEDTMLRVWDIVEGGEERSMEFAAPITGVAFRGTTHIAVSTNRDRRPVRVMPWPLPAKGGVAGGGGGSGGGAWEPTHPDRRGVKAVAIPADGRYLITGCYDGRARVYLWGEAEPVLVVQHPHAPDHSEIKSVGMVPTRPGEYRILTASHHDMTAAVVTMRARRGDDEALHHEAFGALVLKGHTGKLEAACLSQNGVFVVTAGRDRVPRLWDAETGIHLGDLAEHAGVVRTVACSPDSRWIAAGSFASEDNVKVHDANAIFGALYGAPAKALADAASLSGDIAQVISSFFLAR